MRRPLVVVGRRLVVGPDHDLATGKPHHLAAGDDVAPGRQRAPERRGVRRALLELQRLENGLVVLVLVLEHHPVDVAVADERVLVVEVHLLESREHALADLAHHRRALGEPGERQPAAHPARMLERVEQPGHLAELDRSVEVAREPELLEVCDVSEVPHDRAHQRIVLPAQVVVAEGAQEEQRPRARFGECLENLGASLPPDRRSRHRDLRSLESVCVPRPEPRLDVAARRWTRQVTILRRLVQLGFRGGSSENGYDGRCPNSTDGSHRRRSATRGSGARSRPGAIRRVRMLSVVSSYCLHSPCGSGFGLSTTTRWSRLATRAVRSLSSVVTRASWP